LLPVKHLARDCPFGDDERSQRLMDRFIAGLWHEKMVASVFQKKFEDIMFAKAVETAAVLEQARKDVCVIVGQDLSVNATVLNSPSWSSYQEPLLSQVLASRALQGQLKTQSCQGCGGSHSHSNSPFQNAVCQRCGGTCHVWRVYQGQAPSSVNVVKAGDEVHQLGMFPTTTAANHPFEVSVSVNG